MSSKKEVSPKTMKKIIDDLPEEFSKEISVIFAEYLIDHKEDIPQKTRKKLKKLVKEKD